MQWHFYRPHSLAKQGDNKLGSVRLSVFWRTAVDIKGSALPSAAKSIEESLSVIMSPNSFEIPLTPSPSILYL